MRKGVKPDSKEYNDMYENIISVGEYKIEK